MKNFLKVAVGLAVGVYTGFLIGTLGSERVIKNGCDDGEGVTFERVGPGALRVHYVKGETEETEEVKTEE